MNDGPRPASFYQSAYATQAAHDAARTTRSLTERHEHLVRFVEQLTARIEALEARK